MNKIISVVTIILLLNSLSSAANVPPEITASLTLGLKERLGGRTFDAGLKSLGFMNQQEVNHAEIGEIYQVHIVDLEKLRNALKSKKWDNFIVPLHMWEAVITANGNPRTILTTRFDGSRWKATRMGAASLARELAKVKETWPKKKGFSLKYIRFEETSTELIEVAEHGKVKGILNLSSLSRLRKTDNKIEYKPQDLRPPQEIFGLRTR